jgi:hypothetical protein
MELHLIYCYKELIMETDLKIVRETLNRTLDEIELIPLEVGQRYCHISPWLIAVIIKSYNQALKQIERSRNKNDLSTT